MHTRLHRGFTLIEIVVSIVIITIVAMILVVSFVDLNSSQALDKSVFTTVSVFNKARSNTLSSVGDTQYGVHIGSSQVTLFTGTTYAASASTNIVTDLNARVGIRNVALLGGGSDVVFNRQTGSTSQSGSLEVYLLADPTVYKRVTITPTGLVSGS